MATHNPVDGTGLSNEVRREMGSVHPSTLIVIPLPGPALKQCDAFSRLNNLITAGLSAHQATRKKQESIYTISLLPPLQKVSFVRPAMSQTHWSSAMQWA
jgi:hypothetical protein